MQQTEANETKQRGVWNGMVEAQKGCSKKRKFLSFRVLTQFNMPRAREMKSLKGLCLDDVERAVDDWINGLLVDKVSDSGSSVIDLLEKGEDDELYKRVSNFFGILRKFQNVRFGRPNI